MQILRFGAHQWEQLCLPNRSVLENCEESFTEAETARRWHAVLEHLDELVVHHHRLFVALREELLLYVETCTLFDWVVEL